MIAILHADNEWGIGKRNDLMFSLPLDMKFFRETTSGKVVCMGYNTLLSLPNGRPLKNRTNIVLCEKDKVVDGCICVHSVEELLNECKAYNPDDVFIIGGASVYKTMLPYCNKVFLTKVDAIGGAEVSVTGGKNEWTQLKITVGELRAEMATAKNQNANFDTLCISLRTPERDKTTEELIQNTVYFFRNIS